MIRVEGHPNLYRDEKTGAIINTDSSGFAAYQQAKTKKQIEKQSRIKDREDLDNMKQEISEIKEMLAKITSKL
jgi:hypothetical protein|tara:strand:+ start:7266 stop:7484 length:219 start_codon:yes stop_codon:yes gene_type:complete